MSKSADDSMPRWTSMDAGDLDSVMEVEQRVYAFPWTRGNFEDALASKHMAQVLRDPQHLLLGYLVAMPGVDEMHLLNITVRPEAQGRGHARYMLDALAAACRGSVLGQIWLEVRRSNQHALAFYERYGFKEVGRRRAYYPAHHGQREDAVLMSLHLAGRPL